MTGPRISGSSRPRLHDPWCRPSSAFAGIGRQRLRPRWLANSCQRIGSPPGTAREQPTSGSGAGLVIRRPPPLRDGEGFRSLNLPQVFEIGLIADHDDGNRRVVLDADDLFPQRGQFAQRGFRCYAKD